MLNAGRVAVWTPLPPDRSGIADYCALLLPEIARRADVTAVVRDSARHFVTPIEGVEVLGAAEYRPGDFALDVYHMGNHALFHTNIHARALERPGVLVLHDLALVDFYKRLFAGEDTEAFREEVAYNLVTGTGDVPPAPRLRVEGRNVLDPLGVLMCRRLLEASLATVVHSEFAAEELTRRFPRARVVHIAEAAPLRRASVRPPRKEPAGVVFAAIGGISAAKRLGSVLAAFAERRSRLPGSHLVIAGRRDEPYVAGELETSVLRHGLQDSVDLRSDVSEADLDAVLEECDVVVCLRWPTTGETSAAMLRAFSAGRVVIASDSPQNRELDDSFCWRVPSGDDEIEVEALGEMMERAAAHKSRLVAGGVAARRYVELTCAPAGVAARQTELFAELAGERRAVRVEGELGRWPASANAIASWEATTGLTEAARRAVGALVGAEVRVALEDFDYGAPRDARRLPAELRALPRGRPHATDLCFLNINELHVASEEYLRPRRPKRYLVGSWFWELAEIPPPAREQIPRVDEIWVATEFVASVIRQYTDKPIFVTPCVVEPTAAPGLDRSDFGLPEDRVLFLLGFDAKSTLARKNPLGAIEAFERAFSVEERSSSVALVAKTINLASLPEAHALLEGEVRRVGGVVIDDDLSAAEMGSLTSMCDVFVSLHRAEGFGLGLAEAMYFARPVVATGYSGNLDFMDATNSCLVGYSMTTVSYGDLRFNPTAEHVYAPGSSWADPDVAQASAWMRRLFDDPALRGRIGARGQATVRSRFSAAAVGRHMRERLEEIERRPA